MIEGSEVGRAARAARARRSTLVGALLVGLACLVLALARRTEHRFFVPAPGATASAFPPGFIELGAEGARPLAPTSAPVEPSLDRP
jgi:hypothetical protein